MRHRCLITAIFFAASTPLLLSQAFSHPGIYSSQAELDAIRTRLAQNYASDAMVQGYARLTSTSRPNSTYSPADSNYTPEPSSVITRAGNSPVPAQEREDASAAYTQAVIWLAKGSSAARDKAIQIMMAWANLNPTRGTDQGDTLDAAWVCSEWAATGELMEYATYNGEGSGWLSSDITTFKTFVANTATKATGVYSINPDSNWGVSGVLAEMAAGVFTDNRSLYNDGLARLPAIRSDVITSSGATNEISRDPWHGTISITGLIQGAEVARHQGDQSLYLAKRSASDADPAIVLALRWNANPLQGIAQTLPDGTTYNAVVRSLTGPNSNGTAEQSGGWEMAMNYYTYVHPTINLQNFRNMVLTQYRSSNQPDPIWLSSDTLTHGDLGYIGGNPFTSGVQYRLINRSSGKALDTNSQTAAGSPLTQYTVVAGDPNQEWAITAADNIWDSLTAEPTGFHLDNNGSTVSGTAVTQYPVVTTDNQLWFLNPAAGQGYWYVQNKADGFVLDNANSTSNSTQVIQHTVLNNANQQWTIEPAQ